LGESQREASDRMRGSLISLVCESSSTEASVTLQLFAQTPLSLSVNKPVKKSRFMACAPVVPFAFSDERIQVVHRFHTLWNNARDPTPSEH
jgi:hypothetical protein